MKIILLILLTVTGVLGGHLTLAQSISGPPTIIIDNLNHGFTGQEGANLLVTDEIDEKTKGLKHPDRLDSLRILIRNSNDSREIHVSKIGKGFLYHKALSFELNGQSYKLLRKRNEVLLEKIGESNSSIIKLNTVKTLSSPIECCNHSNPPHRYFNFEGEEIREDCCFVGECCD